MPKRKLLSVLLQHRQTAEERRGEEAAAEWAWRRGSPGATVRGKLHASKWATGDKGGREGRQAERDKRARRGGVERTFWRLVRSPFPWYIPPRHPENPERA